MVAQAEEGLADHLPMATFEVADIAALSYADQAFDAVMAHFMLYHVPDLPKALNEVRRVMQSGAVFYATTVGSEHLIELFELISDYDPTGQHERFSPSFTLENGPAQLLDYFINIQRLDYKDHLVVDEPEPLVRYILSSSPADCKTPDRRADLHRFVAARIKAQPLRISKAVGMFRCHN